MIDTKAPALILAPPTHIAALGTTRSLGRLGIPVYATGSGEAPLHGSSRYSRGTLPVRLFADGDGGDARTVEQLMRAGKSLGGGTVLLPLSDDWVLFILRHAAELSQVFRFPRVPPALAHRLTHKGALAALATEHGVAVPDAIVPHSLEEVRERAASLSYPVILKPITSHEGDPMKRIVHAAEDLPDAYGTMRLEGRILCQAYIEPQGDGWLFNGYFDANSSCRAAFTARKLRQAPPRTGILTLGRMERNAEVEDLAIRLLSGIGFHGPVDMDFQWSPKLKTYTLLDLNPRLGGCFRLFVDSRGVDLAQLTYLDATGSPLPDVSPVDGRVWAHDTLLLFGTTGLGARDRLMALRDLARADESSTFSATDPYPWLLHLREVLGEIAQRRWWKLSGRGGASERSHYGAQTDPG